MNKFTIPRKGTEVELKIESLAFGGLGVAHIGDMVVFVKFSLPGQTVRARITRKRSSYLEAIRLEVIRETEDYIPAPCPHVRYCGGCRFQNLSYERQLKEKEQQVLDVFRRLGGFENIDRYPILACDRQYRYRNKMEYTFSRYPWRTTPKDDEAKMALGLHIPRRYDRILDIRECHLQPEIGDSILDTIRQFVLREDIPVYDSRSHSGLMRHVVLRFSEFNGSVMVNLVTLDEDTELLEPLVQELTDRFPFIAGIVNNVNTRKAEISQGEWECLLYGERTIIERIGELEFEISANSFFQTNTRQAQALYRLIRDECRLTGSETVMDLYCGTGSIAQYIARDAEEVVGIEVVSSAVDDAIRNARRNGIDNAAFFKGDLMTFLHSETEGSPLPSPDVVVTDPPRAGMHPKTVRDILTLSPNRIVYVSCNPSTQARDIRMLCDDGYQLKCIRPLDMFPHTPHVENIATLER